ncbi:MAG TPA: S1C family serine protease [Acetobacteraceae bacterium]|nr:S1C family serine protease [Acetobacteraceae bacterium]
MAEKERDIPPNLQPHAADYTFDLDHLLQGIVRLRANVPDAAFTASTLGTERSGSGVAIEGGLVLTMAYLVMEAETVWLTTGDGRVLPGHVLALDVESGFALVQPLGRLDAPELRFGDPDRLEIGAHALLAAAGGRSSAMETRIVGRQEFAGYWEYLLDDALFTAPAHPFWGGTALLGPDGALLGIGSLILQQPDPKGRRVDMNVVVPISRLLPVLGDLVRLGRVNRPARPWLGLFAMENDEAVVVGGLAPGGPAERAGIRAGDRIIAVGGEEISDLAGLWRQIWSCGPAGTLVTLRLARDEDELTVDVLTADRATFLRAPRLH